MNSETTCDAREAVRHITVQIHLTHVQELRFRLWLGRQLIRLAAWVMGTGIRMED